jgi:hypothetical protein
MAARSSGGSKIVVIAAAFVAANLARKVITVAWTRITGDEPPTDPQDPDVELKKALGWSILMGVGMEAARLVTTRVVAARLHRSTASGEAAEADK